MIYPNSNLPTVSQAWGRAIQKGMESLEATIKSNEINNKARDAQLQNSYTLLDKNIEDVKSALTAVGIATTTANTANNTANGIVAGTTAISGAGITTGTLSASKITTGTLDASTVAVTNLNASNITTGSLSADRITAGTMSGDRITGGVITGTTLNTASSGQRVQLSGSNINFYSASSGANTTGYINSGSYGVLMGAGSSSSIYLNGTEMQVTASLLTTGGDISANDFGASGAVTANGGFYTQSGESTFGGFVYAPGIYSQTSSAAANVHIQGAANGYKMYLSTAGSSRSTKRDIRELQFDSDAYIDIKPVVFKYNEGILREEETDWDVIGFIAEDFEDAGFGEQLVTQPSSPDEAVQLRYDKMYMFLHKVVAEQRQTIKDLTARIEALESKV